MTATTSPPAVDVAQVATYLSAVLGTTPGVLHTAAGYGQHLADLLGVGS